MHSARLELTKLTYTRLEDNLIRHRGDRGILRYGTSHRGITGKKSSRTTTTPATTPIIQEQDQNNMNKRTNKNINENKSNDNNENKSNDNNDNNNNGETIIKNNNNLPLLPTREHTRILLADSTNAKNG